MIGSRRTAIIASLLGALLVAGAPTLAFGEGDGTREAKAYSAASTSDEVNAQKAKDEEKKAEEEKKAKEEKKKKKEEKKKKKDGDNKQADRKRDDNGKKDGHKRDGGRKDGDKKEGRDEQASDRKRHDHDRKGHDHGRKGHDHDRKGHHDKDGWKHRDHKDKHNKHWHHDHDHGRRHHYGWDTHRRYYRYGYYGPGYYDQCGYNGGYNDSYYYGPDACRYEYGGYRSHFVVDMSWDQVIPDPNAGGSEARGAYGVANLDIDVPAGVVCFRLAYDGIDRAIGAQIHPGRLGEVGPAIVLLHVGRNGDDGCVSADPAILSEIQNDPRGHYLEVNDEEYGQAMRGQLDAPDYRGRY